MKRLFIILLSIVMCISFSQYVYASDSISDLNSARFEFATEFLTRFYRYAYLCEVSDFSNYIKSDNFLAYINAYSESEYNKRVISNGASKALDVEYELLETYNLEGCVKFELISKLYFTYETYGNKDATEHGIMWRGSEIIVSGTESFEILDWYCEFNDYSIRSAPADPAFWENEAAAEEVLTLLKELTDAWISAHERYNTLTPIPFETVTVHLPNPKYIHEATRLPQFSPVSYGHLTKQLWLAGLKEMH